MRHPVESQHEQASHHDAGAHNITALGYPAPELVKLLHERRLEVVLDLSLGEHLAILGAVAHFSHAHHAMTVGHIRAAQQAVHGIGGIALLVFGLVRFVGQRFAGKRTLVNAHRHTIEQVAVGRHILARVKHHHISHHHIAARNLGHLAVAGHLHQHIVVQFVEYLKFLVGIHFYQETHQRGKHNGNEDAHGFEQHFGRFSCAKVFIGGNAHRQGKSHQQYLDKRVVEAVEKL